MPNRIITSLWINIWTDSTQSWPCRDVNKGQEEAGEYNDGCTTDNPLEAVVCAAGRGF